MNGLRLYHTFIHREKCGKFMQRTLKSSKSGPFKFLVITQLGVMHFKSNVFSLAVAR